MTDSHDRLIALRRAFDDAFRVPARPPRPPDLRLLCVRAGGQALALPIEGIAAVAPCPPLTDLPSNGGPRCALGALRGVLVVVRPVESLLGASVTAAPGRRWIATLRADPGAALSFDEIEGYLEMDAQALSRSSDSRTLGYLQTASSEQRTIVDLERASALSATAPETTT